MGVHVVKGVHMLAYTQVHRPCIPALPHTQTRTHTHTHRFEGLSRDAVPHGMGVMIFGNGTGGGMHFRDVRRGDK
jgi:hypothetical protein